MSDTTNYRKGELGKITGSGGQIKVKFVNDEDDTKWLNLTSDEFAAIENILTAEDKPQHGVTGIEKHRTIDTIAELLWNSDGSPVMDDEDYAAKYKTAAADQYRDYEAGKLDPWWVG